MGNRIAWTFTIEPLYLSLSLVPQRSVMTRILYLILFVIIFCMPSCRVVKSGTEGVILWERYFDSTNSFKYYSNILFKDSVAIINYKAEFSFKEVFGALDENPVTGLDTFGYETLKYTFVDLKSRHCQDYVQLNDTSKPFCNYFLKETEGIDNFFVEKNAVNKEKWTYPPQVISDTIIANNNYKRGRMYFKADSMNMTYCDYYFDCKLKVGPIHHNKLYDSLFGGCVNFRVDFIMPGYPTQIFKFSLERDKLYKSERRLFTKWNKNAKNIKIPLVSYEKSRSECIQKKQPYEFRKITN